jgi:phage repressor protein C with HTH and peptisase S24 domain
MSVGNGGQQRTQASSQGSSSQSATGGPEEWGAIKEDVSQIAGAAVERGRNLIDSTLDSAKSQATSYVDQRKDEVAQSIAGFASSLREATKEFDDRPGIREFVDSAAGGLEQVADSIRERSFNEIFELGEDMVRRRPGAVAAATLVAGFLVARFIKSSAEGIREAEAERRRGSGSQRGGGPGRRPRAQASAGSAYARSGA